MSRLTHARMPNAPMVYNPAYLNDVVRKLTQVMQKLEQDTYRLGTNDVPTTASDSGVKGDIRYDSDYIYVCVDTDTWKRSALTTW